MPVLLEKPDLIIIWSLLCGLSWKRKNALILMAFREFTWLYKASLASTLSLPFKFSDLFTLYIKKKPFLQPSKCQSNWKTISKLFLAFVWDCIKFKLGNASKICQTCVIFIAVNVFPSELRSAEALFIFKKNDPNGKSNYQAIRLLPVMFEIYGEVKYKKRWFIEDFVENTLSLTLCFFRKILFNSKCV